MPQFLNPSLFKKVPEAAYLTAENAHRYRPILRHFFHQYSAHRYWLSADDVLAYMQAQVDRSYTAEQCEQDLAALVSWGNLMAEQEKSRARTVEEFLRRRMRYQLTPYSVAFERLLEELEQAQGTRGSLDATLLESLWSRLEALGRLLGAQSRGPASAPGPPLAPESGAVPRLGRPELQQVHRLWEDAFGAFTRIVNDANDYLAAMHRSRPDDLTRLEDFLAYKDVLIEYLAGFINELMDYAERIRGLLGSWSVQGLPDRLVAALVTYDTTYVAGPEGIRDADEARNAYTGQYEAVAEWFRRGGGVAMLRRVTADAIEMVVRHTQRLVDRRRIGASRRRELEQLARAFAACPTLADAHRLAALALGAATPRHVQGSAERFTLGGRGSVWQQEPDAVPLSRIQRGGRSRSAAAPIRDRKQDQQQVLLQEMDRRRREAALWDQLFGQGEIDLGRLELADPALRARLLEVVGRCLAAPDRTAVASDGSRIQLLEPPAPDDYGSLTAPDGRLITPRFRLRRIREGVR